MVLLENSIKPLKEITLIYLHTLPYFSGYSGMQATVPLGPLHCGPLADKKGNERADKFQRLTPKAEEGKQRSVLPCPKLS